VRSTNCRPIWIPDPARPRPVDWCTGRGEGRSAYTQDPMKYLTAAVTSPASRVISPRKHSLSTGYASTTSCDQFKAVTPVNSI
jgi:hypothetical protein